MKRTLLSALLLGASCLLLSAQSGQFETLQITPDNSPARVSQLEVLGVDNPGKPKTLYFKFVHPGGGVQKVLGVIASGGNEPTDIPAVGMVDLSADGKPAQARLRWVAPPNSGMSINLLVNPAGGQDRSTLARKGNIMPTDSIGILEKALKKSVAKPSPMAESYYETQIKVGGGNINNVTILTYKRRAQPTGLLTAALSIGAEPYKSQGVSYGKKNFEGVLNEGNPDAKVEYARTETRHDPVTGNALVVGGIKYKKDKAKEHNEHYEFRFVTFNKEAKPVANILYKSEEPLVLENVSSFAGMTIAPNVRELTHVSIVARGGGNKKMTGVDPSLLKIIVLNIKTGQIVHESRLTLDGADAKLVKASQMPNGEIEMLYHYAKGNQNGFQVLSISPTGVAHNKTFAHDGPEAKSMKFNLAHIGGAKAETILRRPRPEGGERLLQHFTIRRAALGDRPAFDEKMGMAFFDYDANGHLVSFKGAPDKLAELNSPKLLSATDTQYTFFGMDNPQGKMPKIRFAAMDVATEAVSTQQSPDGHSILDAQAYYIDRTTKSLYFFTKTVTGNGLFLHRFVP